MERYQDFKEFLKLLKEKRVKYLIVGGQAVNYYSRGKLTEDLDIWIESTPENAENIFVVLDKFGTGNLDVDVRDFIQQDKVVQLGYPPMRIDIMTSIEGLDFEKAYMNRSNGNLFGLRNQPYISFNDLIKNKKSTGRPKDKFDILWLKKYFNPKRVK